MDIEPIKPHLLNYSEDKYMKNNKIVLQESKEN